MTHQHSSFAAFIDQHVFAADQENFTGQNPPYATSIYNPQPSSQPQYSQQQTKSPYTSQHNTMQSNAGFGYSNEMSHEYYDSGELLPPTVLSLTPSYATTTTTSPQTVSPHQHRAQFLPPAPTPPPPSTSQHYQNQQFPSQLQPFQQQFGMDSSFESQPYQQHQQQQSLSFQPNQQQPIHNLIQIEQEKHFTFQAVPLVELEPLPLSAQPSHQPSLMQPMKPMQLLSQSSSDQNLQYNISTNTNIATMNRSTLPTNLNTNSNQYIFNNNNNNSHNNAFSSLNQQQQHQHASTHHFSHNPNPQNPQHYNYGYGSSSATSIHATNHSPTSSHSSQYANSVLSAFSASPSLFSQNSHWNSSNDPQYGLALLSAQNTPKNIPPQQHVMNYNNQNTFSQPPPQMSHTNSRYQPSSRGSTEICQQEQPRQQQQQHPSQQQPPTQTTILGFMRAQTPTQPQFFS